jgi:hypothetical protein
MSSIIRTGDTFDGISVDCRGVFTHGTRTYAGQCKSGYACGVGVLTWWDGIKEYAEHGPDGKYIGRHLGRWAGATTSYRLYERGQEKEQAAVLADGSCKYNYVACAPDDPRFLALIAQVAPVEVRPAAVAPTRSRPPFRPQAIVPWISRLILPPQALAKAAATEVHPPRRTPSLVAVRHRPTTGAVQRTTTH